MTSAADRANAVELIDEARANGARLKKACAELRIAQNTYRRWKAGTEDQRPYAERPAPSHKLSAEERRHVLDLCHRPEYASLPPAQIVLHLADDHQIYVASERTFYRILHEHDEQHHRGPKAAPQPPRPKPTLCADRPNRCWSWDVTYLPTAIRGQFFYLYLIIDLYSRKIVGQEVFEAENAANSARLIERATLQEGCRHEDLIIHADNGGPFKGSQLHATLERLGVGSSYSRPAVSNDNAFSESLFGTAKTRPDYPRNGFNDLAEARAWALRFTNWYNAEHRHREINGVTPNQRHAGEDHAILARRKALYEQAKANNPGRWSGPTRNCNPAGPTWLNPPANKERTLTTAA